jgi:1,5-anhydro-D-fructose reductase (1,5-anhydro-D-mannitol-forming)
MVRQALGSRGRTSVPDPITVAVLGFWHVHAAEYAVRVHQHPGTKLVTVWDDDPARGRAAADAVDAAFVGDVDNLVARDDIDAVTVTTATSAHRAIMLRAVQAGKHIFTVNSWRRLSGRPRRSSPRPTTPLLH